MDLTLSTNLVRINLKFQDSNLAGRLQQQGDIEIEDFD